MKSIRQEILSALNKHGEQTADELLDQLAGEFTRKQISDNLYQMRVELLLTNRKDAVTNLPAYKVTDLGKSRIKSVVTDVKESLTTKPVSMPVISTHDHHMKEINDLRKLVDAGADGNNLLHIALTESEQAREIHVKNLIDMESEKVELSRENSMLRESQAEGVQRIDVLGAENAVMKDEIDTLVEECNRLESENMALKTLNESMPGFGAVHEAMKSVKQYLVRNKNTAPTIASSFESARTIAKKTAITHGGMTEVFALVKAGRAHRGAEWVQA